jgi:hypothetical protein
MRSSLVVPVTGARRPGVLLARRLPAAAGAEDLAQPRVPAPLLVGDLGPLGEGAGLPLELELAHVLLPAGGQGALRHAAPPLPLEDRERHAQRLGHGLLGAVAAAHPLEHAANRAGAAPRVHRLHRHRHLREGERRRLLRRQLGHGGVHLGEGDELPGPGGLAEHGRRPRREDVAAGPAPPRLVPAGHALVEPDGRLVAGEAGDDEVHVLVRRRVEPVVAVEHRLRRREHHLVELADGDGPGPLDLLLGERGEARQLANVLHDLHHDLARRDLAEVGEERGPLGLERLEEVGHEHLLLALRVAHDEVRALGADVTAGDVARRLRLREPLAPRRRRPGLLEERDGLVVALLVEPEHADGEGHGRVAVRLGQVRGEDLAGRRHVLVAQAIEGLAGRGARLGRRRGPGPERDEQREQDGRGPHFTSSS